MSDTPAQSNKPDEQVQPFAGFSPPHYTPVPDELLDDFLHVLSGAELKVILYIVRRTFGFKKDADDISLNQMLNGIIKHNGERLDSGTGLSKPTLLKALRTLKNRGLIVSERRQSEEKGDEATRYHLKMKGEEITSDTGSTPVVKKVYHGGGKKSLPGPGKETLPHNKQLTINSHTTHDNPVSESRLNKSNNSSGGKKADVVVALIKKGITENVAKRLCRYSRERVMSKVDYLDFIQATDPDKIKSPNGYLRRAVEDNYAAPDGYSADWRDQLKAKEETVKQNQAAIAQRQAAEESRREAAQEENKRSQEQLRKQYAIDNDTDSLWQRVSTEIKSRTSPLTYACFADSMLLTTEDDQALIAVANKGALDQIMRSQQGDAGLIHLVQQLLGKEYNQKITARFITLKEALDGDPQHGN